MPICMECNYKFQFVDEYIASMQLFRSGMIPRGGVLRCLSRKEASSRKCIETAMEFCTQQTSARMGVLDTLCAIRAARPHIVLLFKTQERGCDAGKRHASSHFGEASNTSPERSCSLLSAKRHPESETIQISVWAHSPVRFLYLLQRPSVVQRTRMKCTETKKYTHKKQNN